MDLEPPGGFTRVAADHPALSRAGRIEEEAAHLVLRRLVPVDKVGAVTRLLQVDWLPIAAALDPHVQAVRVLLLLGSRDVGALEAGGTTVGERAQVE